ncbi:CocE/NonD family hydrolase [Flavobacteriaceae bacterium D16]|nr:CocE/NonD family hydrolase [Flavobacteriaceae bacterium D16]
MLNRTAIPLVILSLILLGSCREEVTEELPTIREIFIPMPDGVQLASDLYLPHNFDTSQKYPIILEYLPYRKDEHRASRYGVFNYFVQNGYIVARVDIRGTGRSEGAIVPYEYSDQELDDGEEVIRQLAALNYSNGNVAVFGISWGGFNGLQLAMRRPPALKTIVSLMSTDDLYQDDVHFMDGILHVDAYEIGRDLDNAFPPSPNFELDSAYFHDRFLSDPWFIKYKKQQNDGPFWDRASLDGNYENFDTPTFLIAGLYDGYRDLVERFFNQTQGAKRAIIGPWNHTWPHRANPGPGVEWRKEVVDWLNLWMIKSEAPNESSYPELILYQRDYHIPGAEVDHIPGAWRVLDKWSNLDRQHKDLMFVSEGFTLSEDKYTEVVKDTIRSLASDGIEGGGPVMWWGDWPPDQSSFYEKSLVYDLELEEELSIMGYPKVRLCVQSESEHVNWIVRLNDVAPDGSSTLVTGGAFNSTHLESASAPKPSPIGEPYCLEIDFHWTTWNFQPGHKLRVAISNAQWPMFWPTPSLGENLVITGGEEGSSIVLPLGYYRAEEGYAWEAIKPDPKLPDFRKLSQGSSSGFAEVNRVEYDTLTQTRTVVAINNWEEAFPWGTYENYESIVHSTSDLDPAITSVEAEYGVNIKLAERQINLETEFLFRSDRDSFYYDYTRSIRENDSLLKAASWEEHIKRDFQ